MSDGHVVLQPVVFFSEAQEPPSLSRESGLNGEPSPSRLWTAHTVHSAGARLRGSLPIFTRSSCRLRRPGWYQVHLLRGTAVAQRLLQLQEVLAVAGGPRLPHGEGLHPVPRLREGHLSDPASDSATHPGPRSRCTQTLFASSASTGQCCNLVPRHCGTFPLRFSAILTCLSPLIHTLCLGRKLMGTLDGKGL